MRAHEGTASSLSLEALSQAVVAAGFEIYRAEQAEIRIAQRIRMHLMDSGVAIAIAPAPRICVTVRAQRSDFPMASAEELIAHVRTAMQALTSERGFEETKAESRDIENPSEAGDVLDVWHELTYAKTFGDASSMLAELAWALSMPKCIDP